MISTTSGVQMVILTESAMAFLASLPLDTKFFDVELVDENGKKAFDVKVYLGGPQSGPSQNIFV